MSRFAILLLLAGPVMAAGRYFEVSYGPSTRPGELAFGVTHRLWIPDGVKQVRGILIHQHGCGVGAARGGQTAAYDLHWQALARKWDMALLGPYYHVEKEEQGCGWSVAENGSAKALLVALRDLAARARRPEVETAPWCLWGHSGGGTWAAGMQNLYPERIIAIWFRSGSRPPVETTPPAAFEVPMMANTGIKEKEDRFVRAWTGSLETFRNYRAKNAPIGFAPDPRTSHECGDSRYLAIAFFDACIRLRLPKNPRETKLRRVDRHSGWLAPLMGSVAEPAAAFRGDPREAVWLPDAATARAWAEYVRTGSGADTTPPAAPMAVSAKRTAEGNVELTWDAVADLESGIQAFEILRDGKVLTQWPVKPANRYGKPLFQQMSYHDTPERPLAEMRFVDGTAGGHRHRYQVRTVNTAGLRSEASKGVRPR